MNKMMVLAYIVALATLGLTVRAHEDNYMICKPVRNFFSSVEQENSTTSRGPQGPPGKRGARGLTGPIGAPGPVGPQPDIDWNTIDQRIKSQLDARSYCDGVVYGQYCFKLIYKAIKSTKGEGKSWAASQCADRGGSLVDIENEEMYNLLYSFIQHEWIAYIDYPQRDYVFVWLASSYETGVLRNSTGGEVYAKWYSGFPNQNSAAVSWVVSTKPTRKAPLIVDVSTVTNEPPSSGRKRKKTRINRAAPYVAHERLRKTPEKSAVFPRNYS